jgi:folate-binding protein YgfZ
MQDQSHAAQLDALRTTAGLLRLADRAFLRISASDRDRWLNGMATNHVAALADTQGCYNFFLNAQGKIQGDAYIFRDGDSFLLETAASQQEALYQHLDHFIIMDDVELAPALEGQTGLLVIGPEAPKHLAALGLPAPQPLHLARSGGTLIIAAYAPTVPRYEIFATPETITELESNLLAAGVPAVAPAAIEALRILEGTPHYGVDIRDRDLPQETGQDRALHFNKGCYLGQEIVERIRSRGAVHRIFTSFTLSSSISELPAPLEADGKPAGELTSATIMPGGEVLALGYARREARERNLPLLYPGGRATPIPLHSKTP